MIRDTRTAMQIESLRSLQRQSEDNEMFLLGIANKLNTTEESHSKESNWYRLENYRLNSELMQFRNITKDDTCSDPDMVSHVWVAAVCIVSTAVICMWTLP